MSNITFEQKTVDGLEFYVSNDGNQTGMSISGLARCCGVHLSTIQKILNNTATASTTIKKLKPFANNVFINQDATASENNAKIVNSEVCAHIITYYAYESKNAMNDVAKRTAEKFMTTGIDNWIKYLCGYHPDEKEDKLMAAINVVLGSVEKLTTEIEELKPIVRKYHQVKEGVICNFPGIDTIITRLENDNKQQSLLEGDIKPVTLTEWLKIKETTLDRGGYCKFGRMVAETFRSCKKEEPTKGNKKNANGKWSNGVTLYKKEHFPILEMAFNQYMAG